MRRIVIVGGGFGGIYAALDLDRAMRRRRDLDVTLVSKNNYFLYFPLLPEVLSGGVEPRHVVVPLRTLFRHVRVLEAEVSRLDPRLRQVAFHRDGMEATWTYDHLVLAPGAASALPQAIAPVVFPFKSAEDAIALRNQIIDCFEAAEFTADLAEQRELLTFVVVGGGATGVECLGEIEAYVHGILGYYPRLSRRDVRLVLLDLAPHILAETGSDLGSWAAQQLRRRGVELRLGVSVAQATPNAAVLSDGTTVATRTIVWTVGLAPGAFLRSLDLPRTPKGWLATDSTLVIPGYEGLWALGDAAKIPAPDGTTYPPTAQHAVREAHRVSCNLLAAIDGRPLVPYRYHTLGTFVSIGGQQGVARLGHRPIRGVVAWWLWRAVHFWLLPGLDRKARILIDWLMSRRTRKDIAQLGLRRPPTQLNVRTRVAFWRGMAEEPATDAEPPLL